MRCFGDCFDIQTHKCDSSAPDYTRSPVETSTTAPPVRRSATELPAILIIKKRTAPVQGLRDGGNVEAEQPTEVEQLPDTLTPTSRSSKRKRDSLPDPPLTRSASLKKPEKSRVSYQAAHRPRKSLRAREAQPGKSQGHSAGRGKGRTPQPGSHNTSRASSIISSTPSDKSSQSMYMHPSPTTDKVTALRPQMPPPLLHTHLRTIPHHHGLPSAIPQIQPQQYVQKSSSIPRQSDSRPTAVADLNAPKPGPSSHPGPPHRSSSSSNSPVTRSHCRYHKISIPRYEDDGPREYFLVPGCSLGNRELIAEELIEDHGDATPEDADRSVNDIVSLEGLNPYLVGIMRQLVGLDRDQEVYYVTPHPGGHVRKFRHSKTPSEKLASARVPPHDSMIGTFGSSVRSPSSSRAPLSTNGSVSTSASLSRKEMDDDPLSTLSSTESDLSDEDASPKFKQARHSLAESDSLGFDGPKNKEETKKRTRITEAFSEPDVEHPKLKKQKTHTNDGTAANVTPPDIL